jgi:hypothetical protein
MNLHGSDLLFALAEKMTGESRRNPDPGEQAKALAMAEIFAVAAKDIREGRAGELHLAVLTQAKLGAHLVGDDE